MLLLFTPIPYMDATASWSFRSRWQRAVVGAAGRYVEMFVAALALFVWAATGPGVVHSIAYNMIFVASVSTVIFNANPLLRFDGYYILSDLLDIPNLHQRSTALLRHLVEYHAFGCKKSTSPARSRQETTWLAGFAVSSGIYKAIVFSAILFFIADQFLILGLLMAVVCAVVWICRPIFQLIVYLASSPRLERTRGRAVAVTAGAAALVLGLLEFVPAPNWFRAPGVLQAQALSVVATPVAGEVAEMLAADGAVVAKGQPLFRLENRELELRLWSALAQLDETEALRRRAMRQATADLAPLATRAEGVRKMVSRLEEDREALTVLSPQAGTWSAPNLRNTVGAWVDRGNSIGQVVDGSQFYFSAIVSQNEASRLFTDSIRGAEVKLEGEAGISLPVSEQKVIPLDRRNLPSAALGWAGGGNLAVDNSDNTGTQAREAFFEVRATIGSASAAMLRHGRGGRIRFELEAEPLLRQWVRNFRQLLQNRYGI
jgi:putative peptide zinc metalloprotease protein